jgi:Tol biopolymer transport system component
MSFTPDGQSVVFHLPRSSSIETEWDVWSVPVTGGEPTLSLRNAASPLYLPGGQELAFIVPATSAFDGQSIAIANGDGSRRTLVEANEGISDQTMSPDGSRIAYMDGGCGTAIGADCSIYVVQVATGVSTKVADGSWSAWLDDHTLIVTPA